MGAKGASVKSERIFQTILVMLGFALGVGSTYFWQLRQDKTNTEAVVALVRAGVENEISVINDEIVMVRQGKDSAERKDIDKVRSALLSSSHDPSVYLPVARDLGILDPYVLGYVDWYVRMLKQCQLSRERLMLKLDGNGQREELMTPYDDYIRSLDNARGFGSNLLKELDRYYPKKY
jgi:hypothetical protein